MNLLTGHPLCHGFDRRNWMKSSGQKPKGSARLLPLFAEPLHFQFAITNARNMGPIELLVVVSTIVLGELAVRFTPSNETVAAFGNRLCAEVRLTFPSAVTSLTCAQLSAQLRDEMKSFFKRMEVSRSVESSRLALWKHNLFVVAQDEPPILVACSRQVLPSSIIFQSLFSSIYHAKPVLVVDEINLHRRYGGRPDVFVFSILDGDCEYYLKPNCQRVIADYLNRYYHPSSSDKPCAVVMFSGEAWNVDGLDKRILLISTVSKVAHERHVYLSMASASFAERIDHDPNGLLISQAQIAGVNPTSRRFCAYM